MATEEKEIAPGRLELPSRDPKSRMTSLLVAKNLTTTLRGCHAG